MSKELKVVRVAAVQAEPVVLDVERTLEKACSLVSEAALAGAKLIVFPELFIPTYVNEIWGRGFSPLSEEARIAARSEWTRLWHNSVEVPGPAMARLGQAAAEACATVVIGVHEREANTRTLYNTIVFIGPDGTLLGKHRKLMPTNHERLVHGQGDGSTLKVFDTPAGRIGGLICWENLMPLARFALYSQGEQVHLAPTAFDGEMAVVNARNTAFEGGVFVISVCMVLRKASFPDDFGLKDELAGTADFLVGGGSCIVAPDGRLLAGPLYKAESILYADLDLNETLEAGQMFDVAGHYSRPDVFRFDFKQRPSSLAPLAAGPALPTTAGTTLPG